MSNFFSRLFARLTGKSAPSGLLGGQWSGTSFTDAFKKQRGPTPNELLAELKNTAFTCASINASVCASFPPRLFLAHADKHRPPVSDRFDTRQLKGETARWVRSLPFLPARIKQADLIVEVVQHPLLTLLEQVNPVHNAFDLWELTTFYQEVHGSAYWYVEKNALGVPSQVWVLPSQNVTPKRNPHSREVVDYYEYRVGANRQVFAPDDVIHFRYPDPRDPYTSGLSPLRAAFESASLSSDYVAFKKAKFENRAIPDAIISPDEVIGEEERDRLEAAWNQRFRRGGAGKVAVAETGVKVHLLNHSIGDIAAMAEQGMTKEDIANAFHVPISFFTKETNLANLQAAKSQHMQQAISPRLKRRDEKLNEKLIPQFDPTGQLFLASEDPVPIDVTATVLQQKLDLQFGVVAINEIRRARGLEPAEWGNTPWLPLQWGPTDMPLRPLYGPRGGHPHAGRARRPQQEEIDNLERAEADPGHPADTDATASAGGGDQT